jgi:hypothetical protein
MHRSITFAYNRAELTMMHEVAAGFEGPLYEVDVVSIPPDPAVPRTSRDVVAAGYVYHEVGSKCVNSDISGTNYEPVDPKAFRDGAEVWVRNGGFLVQVSGLEINVANFFRKLRVAKDKPESTILDDPLEPAPE